MSLKNHHLHLYKRRVAIHVEGDEGGWGGMSFSTQFLAGVSKISANVTEGIRGGHHKSFNDKKKLLLPSSLFCRDLFVSLGGLGEGI